MLGADGFPVDRAEGIASSAALLPARPLTSFRQAAVSLFIAMKLAARVFVQPSRRGQGSPDPIRSTTDTVGDSVVVKSGALDLSYWDDAPMHQIDGTQRKATW